MGSTGCSVERRPGGSAAHGVVPPAGGGGICAAHRLREHCQPSSGPLFRTAARDWDSVGNGREQSTPDRPTLDRERALVPDFWRFCPGYSFILKNAIIRLAPADTPRLNEVDISAGVLFFALLLSMLTGVLFGLVPALQAANPNQVENLREGGRGSGHGRRHSRLSRVLAVSELALSIVLLAGTGLLLRSFWRVLDVRPGFNPAHLATVQIWIPISNNPAADPYSIEEKRADLLLEVFRRVSVLPGVEQASISGNDTLPMNSGRNYSPFSIQG